LDILECSLGLRNKPSRWGNYWKALVPIVVGATLLFLPIPEGLKPNAWYYFALFVAVIIALILEPIPAAAVGLIGVTAATITPWVAAKPADSIKWALSGFQDGTVWLIFVAFMFALGYEKTGLGRRVALNLVKSLGKKTLGLGYAVALADLVLAPFTPSNTARSGGTIFPVIKNIPPLYGSEPGPTARKIGSYLMWTAFATTCFERDVFNRSGAESVGAVTGQDHGQNRYQLDRMVHGHYARGRTALNLLAADRLQNLSS
jgi:L-tartrate/succinate antiporter